MFSNFASESIIFLFLKTISIMKHLNQKLDEMFLENLEERLETDPISVISYVHLEGGENTDVDSPACFVNICGCNSNCPELVSK
jgi:hypothetical protein